MSFDVEEFVRYQIANAAVRAYPFPHFYVQPVFPEAFYQCILQTMPDTEALTPMNEFGTVGIVDAKTGKHRKSEFVPRYLANFSVLEVEEAATHRSDTWRSISAWVLGERFRDLIIGKFISGIYARYGAQVKLLTEVEARFVRDMTDFSIAPHTDTPNKLISLLFYLPPDDSIRSLGTSVFVPKDPAFKSDGKSRHPFDLFKKVTTAGFSPNSLFGFLRTDQAFHGVEVIEKKAVERNLLLYNIYVRKVLAQAPAPASVPADPSE